MDLVALATSATVDHFRNAVHHPLLVAQVPTASAAEPVTPVAWPDVSTDFESDQSTRRLAVRDGALPLAYSAERAHQQAFLIQKVQPNFPSMITLGRTKNNDVVINDLNVSRFHAYFVVDGHRLRLADAGSTTGTWVGQRRLEPKAPPVEVPYGTLVVFGTFPALVLTPEMYWHHVHGSG